MFMGVCGFCATVFESVCIRVFCVHVIVSIIFCMFICGSCIYICVWCVYVRVVCVNLCASICIC